MQLVQSGLDILASEKCERLLGKRVGLLAHPASVDRETVHILDRFLQFDVDVRHLFGAEHGFWGNAQYMEEVADSIDAKTGIPITSLYGNRRDSLYLNSDRLNGLDILVCDLQDIGSRYYTFAYTIAFAMRACAEAGIPCMVLDRPNPIGGSQTEGNLVQPGFFSFVGEYPLQNRHGLTLGELAHRFKAQDALDAELQVLETRGWDRNSYLDQTGLPWVLPSPNMPTVETALIYPGGCLLEGTNLSEGRGTTKPFELVGAPYIEDPDRFARQLSDFQLPGVVFRPCWFTPLWDKHAHRLCGGVQIHVTDRQSFLPLRTGCAMIWTAYSYSGFDWRREAYEFESTRLAIDLLFGTDEVRKAIEQKADFEQVARIACC
ncbi:MAG: DUF1343 domain-containing protein [Myxococcaceae bacterium]|nr:DUF1343 domain-containing protein [Myxococcaceae bacterium]MBH2006461.1 DUF1343 domain-containing protein [Myxococcaceae bacterium]